MLQAQTLLRGSLEGHGLHQVTTAAAQVPAAAFGTSWPPSPSSAVRVCPLGWVETGSSTSIVT